MTDQELNEAVARKLGWKSCDSFEDTGTKGIHWKIGAITRLDLPDYSTDIKAAWEIVGRFNSFYLEYNDSSVEWFCALDNQRRIKEDCRYSASAEIPSRAICEAILKLP